MPRRRQQRKKISKFEFARRKEHQVRFDWEFYREREEQRFLPQLHPTGIASGGNEGGRNGFYLPFSAPLN